MFYEDEDNIDVGVVAIIISSLKDAFNLEARTLNAIREGANIGNILEFDDEDFGIFAQKILDEYMVDLEFDDLEEKLIELHESDEGITLTSLCPILHEYTE